MISVSANTEKVLLSLLRFPSNRRWQVLVCFERGELSVGGGVAGSTEPRKQDKTSERDFQIRQEVTSLESHALKNKEQGMEGKKCKLKVHLKSLENFEES